MDSSSGRFPLDFISFHLDVSSERQSEDAGLPAADPIAPAQSPSGQHADSSHVTRPAGTDSFPGLRPLSNLSSSSDSTEESFSTFAERTLHNLSHMDPSLEITFLAAPGRTPLQGEAEPSSLKVSESEALTSSHPRASQTEVGQHEKSSLFDLSTFDIGEE